MKTTVLSLGGSIVAPEKVDVEFLTRFKASIAGYLEERKDARLILTVGGGAPARIYQEAARKISPSSSAEELDWLGIRATHLNGALVRAVFSEYVENELVTDPTGDFSFDGRILVAAGWKPGFSTDTDAVYLARKFGAKTVVNLSNIKKVYTDDPRKNPDAKPLDHISWDDFIAMVGETWTPGKNTPFDPIASQIARKEGMRVICMDGRNIENLMAMLSDRPFEGTTISL
ncbi:MAG TPA: UMP kinase [Candidatus Ornithospirochaeta stercorigallinarum]|nr:UMP kinase [Candidatus Ornithospirochaeta stercorigallinarum]